ncbi:hypothetical protein DB32_000547 [Sandaracinus amylolyticus]|uniref:Uncharacterized protein n=2 Tax=Sandaracinus amylolyticus TaxID=927083 RepID=A0A0F6VZ87_9BACT|nr:hypothetical protein DB32_000547 [Sandaracinus amylolyticus]
MVAQLASGVANIIGLATRDPNVMKVIRWIDYIMGVNPSPPEQLNFRELAEFCRVWNGGVGVAALAGVRGIAAVAAAAGAATRTSSLAELGRIVNEVAGYVEMATQQICALAQTQAPSSEGSSSNPGDAPRPHPAPDPLAEARRRWRIAMSARVLAEAFIKATPNSRNQRIRENAIRNNCKYACDLENAERSYLEAKRAAGQDATIERFSSTVTPSVRPRRYVDGATAPSGCTCGGGADASRGTGSGAAGVAAAAAGVALVAYLSLRA